MTSQYLLHLKAKISAFVAGVLLLSTSASLLNPLLANADATTQNIAKVSFTFDDGLASGSLAAQALAPYGYSGTDYVITGCVGMTTAPNTCAADPNNTYLTWDQIAELQNTYHWEIGSHTANHPLTAKADNPNLTDMQLDAEMSTSQLLLSAKGYAATDFASPYGDYDNRSLAVIAKYYSSHRAFQDYTQPTATQDTVTNVFPYYAPRNSYPYNNRLLTVQQVQGNIPVATVESYVDAAIANKQWLVLVFHEIKASGASTQEASYEYNATDLATIAAYIKSKSVPVVNIKDGLASGTNIMPNSSFNEALATSTTDTTKWRTDSPTTIKLDAQANAQAGHGSYDGTASGPLNSVSLTGSATDTHLTSPRVSVTPGTTYTLLNYVNVTSTSGEIDFFVNEYDAAGTYLSGKYVQGVTGSTTANAVQVGDVNFMYTPTSATVASAELQVIAHGAGTTAYVDNLQWLAPAGTVVIPPALKAGDVNGDGAVDALDLSTILSNWNKTSTTRAQGDLNSDGTVDALDLSTLLANWSK